MSDVWINKDDPPPYDPTQNPRSASKYPFNRLYKLTTTRDLITQSVISIAFGAAAFLTFCVSSNHKTHLPDRILMFKVAATKVDWSLCCSKKAEECRLEAPRLARYFFRMDTGVT